MDDGMQVPLDAAELLHATLGPLISVLQEAEGMSGWANIASWAVNEYNRIRDAHLTETYPPGAVAEARHQTYLASERVIAASIELEASALDFTIWSEECEGETA